MNIGIFITKISRTICSSVGLLAIYPCAKRFLKQTRFAVSRQLNDSFRQSISRTSVSNSQIRASVLLAICLNRRWNFSVSLTEVSAKSTDATAESESGAGQEGQLPQLVQLPRLVLATC